MLYGIIYSDGVTGTWLPMGDTLTLVRERFGWQRLRSGAVPVGVRPRAEKYRLHYPDGSVGRWYTYSHVETLMGDVAELGPVKRIEFR